MAHPDADELKHRLTTLNAARSAVDRQLDLLRQYAYAPPGGPPGSDIPFDESFIDAYRPLKAAEDEAAEAFASLWAGDRA